MVDKIILNAPKKSKRPKRRPSNVASEMAGIKNRIKGNKPKVEGGSVTNMAKPYTRPKARPKKKK